MSRASKFNFPEQECISTASKSCAVQLEINQLACHTAELRSDKKKGERVAHMRKAAVVYELAASVEYN